MGGHPEDLPGFMQRVFVANRGTRVVDEALARIHREYYRPIGEAQLSNASISGAVASLDDPFSHYLTAKELSEFDHPGSFSGIGVEVNPNPKGLQIVQVFNSTPASRAGLKPEDLIVAVNGRSLAGLPEDEATSLVEGASDTDVTLRVEEPAAPGQAGGNAGAHTSGSASGRAGGSSGHRPSSGNSAGQRAGNLLSAPSPSLAQRSPSRWWPRSRARSTESPSAWWRSPSSAPVPMRKCWKRSSTSCSRSTCAGWCSTCAPTPAAWWKRRS